MAQLWQDLVGLVVQNLGFVAMPTSENFNRDQQLWGSCWRLCYRDSGGQLPGGESVS